MPLMGNLTAEGLTVDVNAALIISNPGTLPSRVSGWWVSAWVEASPSTPPPFGR